MVLQPGVEVRDKDVEQILLGLVKVAKMCAPRHIAHGRDAGFS
jgi:hypothetical protein